MMGSPVIDDTTVYIVDWETAVTALDRLTGEQRWRRKLDDSGFAWAYGVTATPALAGDMLYVPTHFGALIAVDRRSGAEQWRVNARPGTIRATHYQGSQAAAFAAAPVVAGSLVWQGGVDGELRAIDRMSGDLVWSVDLGAPITMGAASAGDLLIVGTYDGTVRAMVRAERLDLSPAGSEVECPTVDVPGLEVSGGGCGCSSSNPTGVGLVLLSLLLVVFRRSPRRR
jgi:MYXO-CTERM domain-containing protein